MPRRGQTDEKNDQDRLKRSCPRCTLICTDATAEKCELCESELPPLPSGARKRKASSSASPSKAKEPLTSRAKTEKPSCLICMEPLGSDGPVQALECLHVFCRSCLVPHLKAQAEGIMCGEYDAATCPTCREPISRELASSCGVLLPDVWDYPYDSDDESLVDVEGEARARLELLRSLEGNPGDEEALLRVDQFARERAAAAAAAMAMIRAVERRARGYGSIDSDDDDDDDDEEEVGCPGGSSMTFSAGPGGSVDVEMDGPSDGVRLHRSSRSASGYMGVRQTTRRGETMFTAVHQGQSLGAYPTALEAARAYAGAHDACVERAGAAVERGDAAARRAATAIAVARAAMGRAEEARLEHGRGAAAAAVARAAVEVAGEAVAESSAASRGARAVFNAPPRGLGPHALRSRGDAAAIAPEAAAAPAAASRSDDRRGRAQPQRRRRRRR